MRELESSERQKWRDLVQRQQAGGLSVAVFCRRHGVAGSSFYAWKRKLGVLPMTHAFVEATVAAAPPADCAATLSGGLIELRLRGGRRVRVGRGFDRDLLIELVATLEGLPSRRKVSP